jgi:hypothetical protein
MNRKMLTLGGLFMFMVSCASVPTWVNKTASSHKECRDTICAVGMADATIKSMSLREETAETRGRARVLEIIESRIKTNITDIRAAEGENTEKAIRQIAEGSLSGVYAADKYVSSDGTVYVLMRLEPTKFKKIIEDNKEINQATRDFLRKRADELLKSDE